MKQNEKGFGVVELALIFFIFSIVGFAGWYFHIRSSVPQKSVSTNESSNSSSTTGDASFSVIVDPMAGGGFTGAVSTYEVTSDGSVYHIHSTDSKTPVTRDLLKKISKEETQALRNTFIKSGVLDLAPGDGPKYGGASLKVTIDGRQKTFFDLSSTKFTEPKAKLNLVFTDAVQL